VLLGWFLGREQGGGFLVLSAVGNGANVAGLPIYVRWGWESAGGWSVHSRQPVLTVAGGMILVCRELRFGRVQAIAGRILDPLALRAAFALEHLGRTFALVSTFALFTNLSSVLGTVLATNALLLQVVTLAGYYLTD